MDRILVRIETVKQQLTASNCYPNLYQCNGSLPLKFNVNESKIETKKEDNNYIMKTEESVKVLILGGEGDDNNKDVVVPISVQERELEIYHH